MYRKEEAIYWLRNLIGNHSDYYDNALEMAIKALEQSEIIRCKDCKYNVSSHKCLHPESFFLVPDDDFYCGYANPRTEKGHWIDEGTNYYCSECHRGCWVDSDYCPWCGADMREVQRF